MIWDPTGPMFPTVGAPSVSFSFWFAFDATLHSVFSIMTVPNGWWYFWNGCIHARVDARLCSRLVESFSNFQIATDATILYPFSVSNEHGTIVILFENECTEWSLH